MAGASGKDNPVGINVTPLVDIIFCLCLFFMCSLKFRPLDGKMDSWLPKDKGAGGPATNQQIDEMRIILSFDTKTNQLQRLFGTRPIDSGENGDKMLAGLIDAQYKSFKSLGKPETPVIIDSGPQVPWQYVIDVMNMCQELRIPKVEFGFGTQHH